jgi:two-component sensor histidine kinase
VKAAILLSGADSCTPSRARAGLREACADAPVELVEDGALLTSEVVTNAVRHSRSETILLEIDCRPSSVDVRVSDDSSAPPVRGAVADETGRGLALLDELAAAWGAEPRKDGPGKTVWFRLDWTE